MLGYLEFRQAQKSSDVGVVTSALNVFSRFLPKLTFSGSVLLNVDSGCQLSFTYTPLFPSLYGTPDCATLTAIVFACEGAAKLSNSMVRCLISTSTGIALPCQSCEYNSVC